VVGGPNPADSERHLANTYARMEIDGIPERRRGHPHRHQHRHGDDPQQPRDQRARQAGWREGARASVISGMRVIRADDWTRRLQRGRLRRPYCCGNGVERNKIGTDATAPAATPRHLWRRDRRHRNLIRPCHDQRRAAGARTSSPRRPHRHRHPRLGQYYDHRPRNPIGTDATGAEILASGSSGFKYRPRRERHHRRTYDRNVVATTPGNGVAVDTTQPRQRDLRQRRPRDRPPYQRPDAQQRRRGHRPGRELVQNYLAITSPNLPGPRPTSDGCSTA
jgi:hypothetical protein